MTKKALLNYRVLEQEVEQLAELIERVETRIIEAKTSKLSQEAKGGGMASDVIGANLAHLEGLRDMYLKRSDDLAAAVIEIEKAIDCLEPTERLLVRYRYIEGLDWAEVATKIGYSHRHTTRLHGVILQKLRNV